MICNKCGAELPEESAVCPKCGAEIVPEAETAPADNTEPIESAEDIAPAESAENAAPAPVIAPKKSFWKKHKKLIIAAAALILAAVIACAVINAIKNSPTARAKGFVAEAEKLLDGKADVRKLVDYVLPEKAVKKTVDRVAVYYNYFIQLNSMYGGEDDETLNTIKELFPNGITEDSLFSALQKYADKIPEMMREEEAEIEKSITYIGTENVDKSIAERNRPYYSLSFSVEPTDAKLVKFHADIKLKQNGEEAENIDSDFGLLMLRIEGKWYVGGIEYEGEIYDLSSLTSLPSGIDMTELLGQ